MRQAKTTPIIGIGGQMSYGRLTKDDQGLLFALYEDYPIMRTLFENGSIFARNLGLIPTMQCVRANRWLVEHRGEKPLFGLNMKTGEITMLRWHEQLLEGLKVMEKMKPKNL